MEERELTELRDELQRLRDEQQRLRDEQETVRRELHAHSNGNAQDGEKPSGDRTPAGGEGEGNRQAQTEREKPGTRDHPGDKNETHSDDEGEDRKPHLSERVRYYVRTHRIGVLIGLAAFIVVAVGTIFLLLYLASYESTDDAQVEAHLHSITSRIADTVTGVYAENNQSVTAGQLLIDLDPRDYQAALDQARGAYSQAVAQLSAQNPNIPITQTTNVTQILTTQADVAAADAALAGARQDYQAKQANLRQAEANNVKAQMDVKRYAYLVEKAEVSQEQFDTVVANGKTQAAAVDAATASANAAAKAVDQAKAQLAQAQSRLAQARSNAPRSVAIQLAGVKGRQAGLLAAKAQSEQAQFNLSYCQIFSPVAGIVSERSAEVGQQLQPGEQTMVVSEIGDIWITANFKETQLRKMRPGQTAEIHVDAYNVTYRGYVESMPGATGAVTSLLPPENATGNYVKVVQRLPVRLRLKAGEDPHHLLRPGMSVEPKVWLK